MKNYVNKLVVFAILVVASFSTAKAQTTFVVNEVRQFMSKGEQNGFEVILNGTSADDAKDALEKWAKKFKAKVESSKKIRKYSLTMLQYLPCLLIPLICMRW